MPTCPGAPRGPRLRQPGWGWTRAPAGRLTEAELELGPSEVWPRGSFWPPSPLFLTYSFQERGTVLKTLRQEVGMQSRLAQPAAATSLPGPHVLVGRWGDISGCPRLRPFLPHLLWHGKGSWSDTDRGWNLSVRAGGVSCTDGPTAVERGLDLPGPCPVRTQEEQDATLTRRGCACL